MGDYTSPYQKNQPTMFDALRQLQQANEANAQRDQQQSQFQNTLNLQKKTQLADFLTKGINPDASGLNELGQAKQGAEIAGAQHTTAGYDPNSPLSKNLGSYIGQVSGQPAPQLGASDIEKVQPMIDTAMKSKGAVDLQKEKEAADTRQMGQAQDIIKQNAGQGRKVSAHIGGASITQQEPNMYQQQMEIQSKLGKEAQSVSKLIEPHLKPIKSQLDASENTLNYLDQGNPVADKAALINEATMLAGGSGSRAIGALVAQISGDSTMAQDTQKALNWLNNTAQVNMQPAQRNAIREMVIQRLPTLQQQYQGVKKQISAQIPQYAALHASMGQVQPLIDQTFSSTEDSVKRMNDANTKYMQAKAQAGNPTVSRPSTFSQQSDNPGMIQQLKDSAMSKLHQFLGGGNQQATPPTIPSGSMQSAPQSGTISFEEFKARKKAGTL